MSYDRKFLIWALCYAVVGMGLGIFMAASHNHGQHVTHAHILLIGLVVSFIYAAIHKLWLGDAGGGLACAQFLIHHAGALVAFAGLFLLYGNFLPLATMDPILAVASIAILIGMVLMLFMVVKAGKASA